VITYCCGQREKEYFEKKIIIEKKHGPFGASDLWDDEPIVIPYLPPTGLPHCNLISIGYRIEV